MRTSKIELDSWAADLTEPTIDIDWPRVQRKIGRRSVEWLLKQPAETCQLMVEKTNNTYRLVAEFYDDLALDHFKLLYHK